jgi:DNA mismatch repair protein MSH2
MWPFTPILLAIGFCKERYFNLIQASPGNPLDLIGDSSCTIASVFILESTDLIVGCAITDTASNRVISVSEFMDDLSFSNLESFFIQNNVKECLVLKDLSCIAKLETVLLRCGASGTLLSKADYKSANVEQDLEKLLATDIAVNSISELTLKNAMKALAALILYLELLGDESSFNRYVLRTCNLRQYMRIDAAAAEALNLVNNHSSAKNSKTMNLYGILNQCKTSQGSRMLLQWIMQPLLSLDEIQKRQNLIQILFDDISLTSSLREEYLKFIPDLHRLGRKLQKSSANLQDVVRIYQFIVKLQSMIEYLGSFQSPSFDLFSESFTKPLLSCSSNIQKLKEMIETTVDLEAADAHEFLIKADFHPELKDIRIQMDIALQDMDKEAQDVANDLGLEYGKKLKFEKNQTYGYILRISRNDGGCIRGDSQYTTLATQKAGILFNTHKLRKTASDQEELSKTYQKIQSNVCKEVISITASYIPVLENLNELIANLDVIVSLAKVAKTARIEYVRPKVTLKGF